jgi:hypothetical protein
MDLKLAAIARTGIDFADRETPAKAPRDDTAQRRTREVEIDRPFAHRFRAGLGLILMPEVPVETPCYSRALRARPA